MMMEVTCECGWQTRGTQDEVVDKVREHGRKEHGQDLTREQVLEIAREVK